MSLKMLLLLVLMHVVLCQCKFIDELYSKDQLDEIRDNPFYRFTRSMQTCDSNKKITSKIEHLTNIDCRPFPTLVPVEPASMQLGDFIDPSHVILHRCAGHCFTSHSSFVACTATRKKTVNVEVKFLAGTKRANCVVQMTNETHCECNCKNKPSDCNAKQEWDQNKCQCVCKPHLVTACELKGKDYKWDHETCSCGCMLLMCENPAMGQPDISNNCKCTPNKLASPISN